MHAYKDNPFISGQFFCIIFHDFFNFNGHSFVLEFKGSHFSLRIKYGNYINRMIHDFHLIHFLKNNRTYVLEIIIPCIFRFEKQKSKQKNSQKNIENTDMTDSAILIQENRSESGKGKLKELKRMTLRAFSLLERQRNRSKTGNWSDSIPKKVGSCKIIQH